MDGKITLSAHKAVHDYICASRRGKYTFPEIPDIEVQKTVSDISGTEAIEFGDVGQDEAAKSYRARKRALESDEKARQKQLAYLEENEDNIKRVKEMRTEIRRSLLAKLASKQELSKLRQMAKRAMLKASKQASEPVIFCCGDIRPATYECPLNRDHGPEVLEVNSW